jgi:hypothetical protein
MRYSLSNVAALVLATVLSQAQAQVTLVPGRVVGDIKFTGVTAPVSAQLTADPPIAGGSEAFLRTLPGGSFAAQGAYSVVPLAAGSEVTLGALDLHPNVSTVGSNFLLSVEDLRFTSGARYRFASGDSGSPAIRVCSAVQPLTSNPNGTRCDLQECASVANVRVRFLGSTADLDALDTAVQATCSAQSSIQDLVDSGPFRRQAQSAMGTFAVSSLRAGYQSIPMLLRGNWSSRIDVTCNVKVRPGETGFVVLPTTGLTPVGASRTVVPACPSGSAVDIPVDIVVARTAGSAQGKLDVVGRTEERASVRFGPYDSPFVAQAAVDPTDPAGPLQWALTGVPAGTYPVSAWTLVDSRDRFVVFPARDNINNQVTVTAGATTDLGRTFVAKPAEVKGRLTVFDFGQTHLSTLVTAPFPVNENPPPFSSSSTSFAQAEGNPLLPASGGASGTGGVSRGRLQGPYDAAAGQAVLDYHLLLPGIGLPGSAVDGTQARNTLWNFSTYNLRLTPPNNTVQTMSFTPATYLAVETGAPAAGTLTQAPAHSVCTGRVDMEIRVAPTVGTLFNPSASITSTGLYQEVAVGTTPVTRASSFVSRSVNFTQRASSLQMSSTLPSGLRYRFQPTVRFAPAAATVESESTSVYLGAVEVPEQGVLGCGSNSSTCVSVGNPNGPATQLSVAIVDVNGVNSPTYCLASGAGQLKIRVNSDNVPVSRVAYVIDPATPNACATSPTQVLCDAGTCPSDPEFTVTLPALPAGAHTILACASDTSTCNASHSFAFSVTSQNLGLTCPAPIAVQLNSGETGLPRTDPRIASALVAAIGGSCGVPSAIADNAPAIFPIGVTPVTFDALNIGTCSTPVTVKPAAERVLSFTSNDASIGQRVLRKRSFLDDSVDTILHADPQQYHFEYNNAGTRIAVIPNASGVVRILEAVTGAPQSHFPVPAGYRLFDVDFHPADPTKYALVGSLNSTPDQHAIFIYQGSTQLSRFDMPLFAASLRISRPMIAWSPDGTRISASFTQPAPAINKYEVWFSEWNVVNDRIVLPPVGGIYEQRPPLGNRETLREMAYQDADWRVVGTDLTITRGVKRPGNELIGPIWATKNVDLDLTPDGKAAAYLVGFATTPGNNPYRIYVAQPLDRNAVPTVTSGPVVIDARSIAISSDAKYVAVATSSRVRVYSLPGFSLVKEITAVAPANLEFRPMVP